MASSIAEAFREKSPSKDKKNKRNNSGVINNNCNMKKRNNNSNTHTQRKFVIKPYGEAMSAKVTEKPADIATAPYNFIPLPKQVLPSPLDACFKHQPSAKGMKEYLEKNQVVSGSIQLDIETITPVYINGENGRTFSPAGKPIIPGSSLRGMTKNLFKMITCGTWHDKEDITDRHLYYRCLMSTDKTPYNKSLNKKYTDKMTSEENKKTVKNPRPGFIVKRKDKWYIYSLLPDSLHSIPIWKYANKFNLHVKSNLKKSSIRWDKGCAYVQIGLTNPNQVLMSDKDLKSATESQRKKWGKQYYKYIKIEDIDKSKKGCHLVPDEVIYSYQHDTNRRGVNLLDKRTVNSKEAPKSIKGIPEFEQIAPCFYLMDSSGQIKSFGHGQSYRIPYDNSIMDAIPNSLKVDTIDFSDAVFGHSATSDKEISWASRVAFDDATIKENKGNASTAVSHMMMQPNPTSFQLYLEQNQNGCLTDWDSKIKSKNIAKIRGYKMYWHSSKNHEWKANQSELDTVNARADGTPQLQKKITPLNPGNTFTAFIRFYDLTKEELGALLRVFYLGNKDQDIAYKIGMGKGIGLGSIRICPHLMLEDGSRYTTLFDKDSWHISQKEDGFTI